MDLDSLITAIGLKEVREQETKSIAPENQPYICPSTGTNLIKERWKNPSPKSFIISMMSLKQIVWKSHLFLKFFCNLSDLVHSLELAVSGTGEITPNIHLPISRNYLCLPAYLPINSL